MTTRDGYLQTSPRAEAGVARLHHSGVVWLYGRLGSSMGAGGASWHAEANIVQLAGLEREIAAGAEGDSGDIVGVFGEHGGRR